MKCTAKEFIELVRKMRELQSTEDQLDDVKMKLLFAFERQVDEAEITDIWNLETNQSLV